jgi:hypothetical protein
MAGLDPATKCGRKDAGAPAPNGMFTRSRGGLSSIPRLRVNLLWALRARWVAGSRPAMVIEREGG